MNLTADYVRRIRYRAMALGRAMLLAGVVIGSTASLARAGCGDYVVIGNPLHTTQEQAAPELATVMPLEHPAPQPCHGPGCQRRDAFPPTPIPIAPTPSPEFAAIPPVGNGSVTAEGESRIDVRGSRRVEGIFDRVERPPRDIARTALGSW